MRKWQRGNGSESGSWSEIWRGNESERLLISICMLLISSADEWINVNLAHNFGAGPNLNLPRNLLMHTFHFACETSRRHIGTGITIAIGSSIKWKLNNFNPEIWELPLFHNVPILSCHVVRFFRLISALQTVKQVNLSLALYSTVHDVLEQKCEFPFQLFFSTRAHSLSPSERCPLE